MVKLLEYQTRDQAAEFIAEHIADEINKFNPTESNPFVLGLPTGSSPEPVYQQLIQLYRDKKVSFKNVVTFNMDEYCGLDPSNDQSYHYFMYTKFFNHIDIQNKNIYILDGLAKDFEKECQLYEDEIAKYAPFQIFMGGVGAKGHIAFNEAGSPRDSKTREVSLEESTINANSRFFNSDESKVPRFALSMGISTVLDNSKEVIILVFGKSKANILNKTLNSPMSPEIPSTFIRDHKNSLIICDSEASAELPKSNSNHISKI